MKKLSHPNLVCEIRASSSNKERARVIREINFFGKKSKDERQISDSCRSGSEESVGRVNAAQPLGSRGVMVSVGYLMLFLWGVFLVIWFHRWVYFFQDNKQFLFSWSPPTSLVVLRKLLSQNQQITGQQTKTIKKSSLSVSRCEGLWYKMVEARAEDLVIRLEESLGISNLESGPKLAGAIIAGKIPNR